MSFRFYHTVFSAAAQEPFFRSVRGRKGFSMKVNPLLLVEYARAARPKKPCRPEAERTDEKAGIA